jgi:hypothetical protein
MTEMEDCAGALVAAPDAPAGVAGITFTIQQVEYRGRLAQLVTAKWEGREHWAVGQAGVADVAKLLVGAGCPDQEWQAVDAAHEVLFRGSSLHQLANAPPPRGKAA